MLQWAKDWVRGSQVPQGSISCLPIPQNGDMPSVIGYGYHQLPSLHGTPGTHCLPMSGPFPKWGGMNRWVNSWVDCSESLRTAWCGLRLRSSDVPIFWTSKTSVSNDKRSPWLHCCFRQGLKENIQKSLCALWIGYLLTGRPKHQVWTCIFFGKFDKYVPKMY